MNIIEKLEKYFNTGSTDKQNKRRLGGLLIGITAILLVLAIVAVSIGGVVAAVGGIIDAFNKPDDMVEGDGGVNTNLVDVAASDVTGSGKYTTAVLENTAPANMTVSTFGDVKNNQYRFKNGVDKEGGYVYKATHKDGLQPEALTAFNAMMAELHKQSAKELIVWANDAYSTEDGAVNGSHYANALAVDIWYEYPDETNPNETKTAPIYGNTDFDWLFKNAYKYGFVRVSDADGEESIFRYVGLAHAKYIYDKQTKAKNDDPFYGIGSYLAEIKATTPDTEMSVKGVKALGESTTAQYYVYYMTVAEGQTCKLPKNSYDYNIQQTAEGGYVVTYWKNVKK